jgi:hypothetical protein
MMEMDRIRFITTNYGSLQGLKLVPLGFLVLFIALWMNKQTGPSTNLLAPLLLISVVISAAILSYALTERYYHRIFGRVEQKREELRTDVLICILSAPIGLIGFLIDRVVRKPVSVFTLLFAAVLLITYIIMIRRAGGRSLLAFPTLLVFVVLLGLIALFPMVGRDTWQAMSFQSWQFAAFAALGILFVVFGLVIHFQLVASMPKPHEKG